MKVCNLDLLNLKRMALNSKKVLITGINGQLGSALSKYLANFYNITNDFLEETAIIDVTDREFIQQIMLDHCPDYVINCAAATNVDKCELNRKWAYDVNVNGIKNIIASTKLNTKIIHISTDYVFDGKKDSFNEKDPPSPLSYYGKTKLEAENILRSSNREHLILRTSVIFGNYGNNFYTWVYKSLLDNKKISVVTDQISNPTWAWSLSEAIYKSMINNLHGLYHFAGDEIISRYEFALKIANINNLNSDNIIPIETKELQQSAKRPSCSTLNTDKIREQISIEHPSIEYVLNTINKNDV